MCDFKRLIYKNQNVRTFREDDGRILVCVIDLMSICSCTSLHKYVRGDADYTIFDKDRAEGKGFYSHYVKGLGFISIDGIHRIADSGKMRKASRDVMVDCAQFCSDQWENKVSVNVDDNSESEIRICNKTDAAALADTRQKFKNAEYENRIRDLESRYELLRQENAEIMRRYNEISEENERLIANARNSDTESGNCDITNIVSVLEGKLNEARVTARKYEEIINLIKGIA